MSEVWKVCQCASCTAWRVAHPEPVAEFEPVQTEPTPGDLQESLRSLVALIDRQGGYMTPEDQVALCRAETLLGLR